jgi:hypothetical protein
MPNRQLNFLDFYIAQTITPDDRIKQVFDAINWQEVEKLKPQRQHNLRLYQSQTNPQRPCLENLS